MLANAGSRRYWDQRPVPVLAERRAPTAEHRGSDEGEGGGRRCWELRAEREGGERYGAAPCSCES
jgi:hypothetical protein